MVDVDFWLILGNFVDSLLSIQFAGFTMGSWMLLLWILAIIGWILQAMYGRKEK